MSQSKAKTPINHAKCTLNGSDKLDPPRSPHIEMERLPPANETAESHHPNRITMKYGVRLAIILQPEVFSLMLLKPAEPFFVLNIFGLRQSETESWHSLSLEQRSRMLQHLKNESN
jgi:hypothetical protein